MKNNNFKRSITILAGLSLTTMHILNRIETTNAYSIFKANTREDKTYDWRYGKISYKKLGHGSPILLLHDLTIGSCKEEFINIYNKLSKNHTVYVLDLIGYGESEKPSITYTASLYEQLIEEFIKNVINKKTDIVVTGDTAPIILKLTHNHSDLIEKIIMINPLGLYDQNLIPSNQTKLLNILIDLPIVGTFSYNLNSTKSIIEHTFLTKYISDSSKVNISEIVNLYYRSAHTSGHNSKYSYSSYLSKYTTCSILHELKEINNSIIIIGGSDELNIKDNIENYLYYNNAIESEIIPNTSHLPHIEKPDEVLDIIEVFLS